MNFGIVVDSSSDILEKDINSDLYDFTVVPLKISANGNQYIDNGSVDLDALLYDMSQSVEASKSACPSPFDFEQAFKKSQNVFCFTMTSALSGTYNSARVAKDQLDDENAGINICVIDSKATAGNLALLVNKCEELIKQQLSFDTICEQLSQYNQQLKLIFTLGSYDNLVKTGRMSNFAKGIADALNIKAVCKNTKDGEIEVTKKVRGTNRLYKTMVEMMKNDKDLTDQPIYISHCKSDEAVITLIQLIKQELNTNNIHISPCQCLTTFYAMEGGVIISY